MTLSLTEKCLCNFMVEIGGHTVKYKMSADFSLVKKQCIDIAKIINQNEINLIEYVPDSEAQYEIDMDKTQQYFKKKVDAISVFTPPNLPLFLLGSTLVPGFIVAKIRQPEIMRNMYNDLKIKVYLPNMLLTAERHNVFIERYVKKSSAIVFTGRDIAKAKIVRIMPKNSILIFNGSRHNLVIVAEDAKIDKIVKDTMLVKFFDSGQDCAGPDSIITYKKISSEFIKKFRNSKDALSVIYKNSHGEISKRALPIFIPDLITKLLIQKKIIDIFQMQSSFLPRGVQDSDVDFVLKIEYEFRQQVNNIFANNVEFAFIFGSMAKRTFRRKESDIDTFICLKEDDKKNVDTFKSWIAQFQNSLDLKPDLNYPSEIMTYKDLESALQNLNAIKISFSYSIKNSETYDKIFWACVLSSFHKKRAFVGGAEGGRKLCSLVKKCKLYPKKWGEEFVQLFNHTKNIPAALKRRYEDLSKEQIGQKLNELLKEHEYCEIMRLSEFNEIESGSS